MATDVPSWFVCPISQQIMFDPVNLGEDTEHSYEREEMERHVARPGSLHPFTRTPLKSSTKLVSNALLRRMIQDYLQQHPDVMLSCDDYYLSTRFVDEFRAALSNAAFDAAELRRFLDRDRRLLFVPFEQANGMTALHEAASAPNAKAVEALLGELSKTPERLKAVVSHLDHNGRLPVYCAVAGKLDPSALASLMTATLAAGVKLSAPATATGGSATGGGGGAGGVVAGPWLDECFAAAVVDGRLEAAAAFLQLGADVNTAVRLGGDAKYGQQNVDFKQVVLNPLLRAAASGPLESVAFLLDKGAQLHPHLRLPPAPATAAAAAEGGGQSSRAAPAVESDFSALHCAAAFSESNAAKVELLLRRGADVNAVQQTGLTALHFCYAHKGPEELSVVRLLLDAGADANIAGSGIHGFTPLVLACYNQNLELASLLLNRGANVNFRAQNGLSALSVATMRGNEPLVALLLQHGAAAADAKCVKLGPLAPETDDICLFAIQRGFASILDLLLAHGADANRPTPLGTSLLHEAVAARRLDCAAVLLRRGALPAYALHQAASLGETGLVQLLLDHKADVNAVSPVAGETALHAALEAGNWPMAETLFQLAGSVDPSLRDTKGRTALHRAVRRGAPLSCLEALFRLGADESIDAQDADGNTALHLAIAYQNANRRETIEALLAAGACCFLRNKAAKTPLDIVSAQEAAGMRDASLLAMQQTSRQLRLDNRLLRSELSELRQQLAALQAAVADKNASS